MKKYAFPIDPLSKLTDSINSWKTKSEEFFDKVDLLDEVEFGKVDAKFYYLTDKGFVIITHQSWTKKSRISLDLFRGDLGVDGCTCGECIDFGKMSGSINRQNSYEGRMYKSSSERNFVEETKPIANWIDPYTEPLKDYVISSMFKRSEDFVEIEKASNKMQIFDGIAKHDIVLLNVLGDHAEEQNNIDLQKAIQNIIHEVGSTARQETRMRRALRR